MERTGTNWNGTRSVLAAVSLAAAVWAPTAQAAPKPRVTTGAYPEKTVIRPSSFSAGTGVGGGVMGLKRVTWSSWGTKTATGRGTLTYNTCEPGCADGNLKTVKTSIKLSAVRSGCELPGENGESFESPYPLFTHIALKFSGAPVWRSITADTQGCQ